MVIAIYILITCLVILAVLSVGWIIYIMISTIRDEREFDKRMRKYDEEDPIDGYVDYYWFK